MNKLVKIPAPPNFFADHFIAVEGTTPEGHAYTFGRIIHNKYGRSNLVAAVGNGFYAGSRSRLAVAQYARTVDPLSKRQVFINAGRLQEV